MTAPTTSSSFLTITGQSTQWTMNVVAFSSPIYGQINSVQTKSLAVHFPIKMAMPDMSIDVQFYNQTDFQNFQAFARNHQQQLSTNSTALLTFNWPERGIYNYTGFIPKMQAGGARANYAPRARIEVTWVDSMITARTDLASVAANWRSIYGGIGMPNGVLALPTAAQMDQNIVQFGQNPLNGAFVSVLGGSRNGTGNSTLPGILANS